MAMDLQGDMGCCGAFSCLTGSLLVLHIFNWLELHDLFRIRLVCKSWYEAILSTPFMQLYRPPNVPWVLLKFRRQERQDLHQLKLTDYENKLVTSQQIWCPSSSQPLRKSSLPLGPPGSLFFGLGSSNGLVCGRVLRDRHELTLAVGNPLTNKWKILPPAPVHGNYSFIDRPAFMEFAIDRAPATGHYIIVIFLRSERVVQYDSKLGAWIQGPCLPSASSYPRAPIKNLRGCAFLVNPLVITSYDPGSGVCSQIKLPLLNSIIHAGFRYKNKSIFAASLYESIEFLGVGVYEFKDSNWILISRAQARDLFGDGCNACDRNLDWKIDLAGDMLIFSTFFKTWTHGLWAPVAYDLVKNSWHCLFGHHDTQHSWSKNMKRHRVPSSWSDKVINVDVECTYAFVPSLKAQP